MVYLKHTNWFPHRQNTYLTDQVVVQKQIQTDQCIVKMCNTLYMFTEREREHD